MSKSACLMLASKQKEYKASTNSLCLKSSSVLSSCRICLSSIFKPALLTCGHKFCENCLDDYWRVKEKPNFLICPLCRAQVYNVDFTEKEEGLNQPSKEFRKSFSLLETVDATDTNKSTLIYFKITMMISIVYYLLMLWLKLPTEDLFRWKLWYKM